MTALSAARSGAHYQIKWNVCTGRNAAQTAKLGLCPGVWVFLVSSYFGSVIVHVNGRLVALSEDVAVRIKV